MTEQPSGKLYTAVTKYWPRIAAGLVGFVGAIEWASGSTTPGFTLGFYVFACATATGGLWFMFEMAEKALSEESRDKVVGWVRETNLRSGIESIPDQFVLLFDRIFGEKHLSRYCFNRSCAASLVSVVLVFVLLLAVAPRLLGHSHPRWALRHSN